MKPEPPVLLPPERALPALQIYLLGMVDFEAALGLQRRLVYEVAGKRDSAALVLCEHPPLVTIGRHGSWRHVLWDAAELRARRWPVRWVNRGGGCVLHAPGQTAIYPILPLDRLQLGLEAYLHDLRHVLIAVLNDFSIEATTRAGQAEVWSGSRPIASVGVAVRDWVSYYGAALNINPDLSLYRAVRTGGDQGAIMTSVERERRGPLRPALVRERFIETFCECFGFAQPAIFFDHPSLRRKARSDALAPSA
ncbi:MAG: lipoyl(octanoyl) transferase LipB [Planctomycetota bacterium]|nr:MAG: lipoyl(octanoyl) transferase LipB [Planctomycetota bacterium]